MSEIKVGEYVRYSDGDIQKTQENYIDYFNYVLRNGERLEDGERKIVKHSSNIIDLIEYGDVLEIFVNDNDIQKIVVYGDELYSLKIGELIAEDIKSIVTHEQFQSVEYRLEEE